VYVIKTAHSLYITRTGYIAWHESLFFRTPFYITASTEKNSEYVHDLFLQEPRSWLTSWYK